MSGPDIRWQQRLQSFRKAFKRLSDAVQISQARKLSELEQQGLIQAFEFTHDIVNHWFKANAITLIQPAAEAFNSKPSRSRVSPPNHWKRQNPL